jgi:hypothetical protein
MESNTSFNRRRGTPGAASIAQFGEKNQINPIALCGMASIDQGQRHAGASGGHMPSHLKLNDTTFYHVLGYLNLLGP